MHGVAWEERGRKNAHLVSGNGRPVKESEKSSSRRWHLEWALRTSGFSIRIDGESFPTDGSRNRKGMFEE